MKMSNLPGAAGAPDSYDHGSVGRARTPRDDHEDEDYIDAEFWEESKWKRRWRSFTGFFSRTRAWSWFRNFFVKSDSRESMTEEDLRATEARKWNRWGWGILIAGAIVTITLFYKFPIFGLASAVLMVVFIRRKVCWGLTDPDLGLMFRDGQFIAVLKPGKWYAEVPFRTNIIILSRGWAQLTDVDRIIYQNDEGGDRASDYADVGFEILFRPKDGWDNLQDVIGLPPAEMAAHLDAMAKSEIQRLMANKGLATIRRSLKAIEDGICDHIRQAADGHGYETSTFKLNPTFPTVEAMADGRARADSARRMAEAIEGNREASHVTIATVLADGLVRVFGAGKAADTNIRDVVSDAIDEAVAKMRGNS